MSRIGITRLASILLAWVALGVCATASHAAGPAPRALAWTTQAVDAPRTFTNLSPSSLRLDRDGNPHIVYGGDHLYYASFDGTGWLVQVVDGAPAVGARAALALDANDNPSIAYFDAFHADLRFAHRTGTTWQIETVASDGDVGQDPSLALDAAGRAHISYGAQLPGYRAAIQVARWTGAVWEIQRVDPEEGWVGTSSLALDADGHAHVAYYHRAIGGLEAGTFRYARWSGTAWEIEIIASVAQFEGQIALALDSAANPRVVYNDLHANALQYAQRSEPFWITQSVLDGWCYDPSLTLDAAGHPHISLARGSDGELSYLYWTGSAWMRRVLGSGGSNTTLALGYADRPSIAYLATGGPGMRLRYARWDGVQWLSETVDQAGGVGTFTALKLDASARPHISYVDRANAALKYAYWTGTTWVTQTVGSAGSWVSGTSLALDRAGRPRIAYGVDGELRYARWTGSAWDIRTIGNLGAEGGSVALALDAADSAHIACDVHTTGGLYTGTLLYVHQVGDAWETQIVDESTHVSGPVSLAVDSAGHPHISYAAKGLRYAWWTGQVWARVLVDDQGGADSSLALDADDHPHISYQGRGTQYAAWTGSAWVTETVDSSGSGFTSLALDAAGAPQISYYAHAGGLRYAHRGEGWVTELVDTQGDVGQYTALALDAGGRAHISYYDASNQDLKYAVGRAAVPPLPTPTPTPVPTATPSPTPVGPGWSLETVAAPPFFDAMRDRSLRLDGAGQPHIAYGGDHLYYARYDGSAWRLEVVDEAPGVGRQAALALDALGYAHIAYRDAVQGIVKYAVWTGAQWRIETVAAGDHPSLALDADGQPHLSLAAAGGLQYARRVEGRWQTETVDNDGTATTDTSLALDAAGRPRIGYAQSYCWAVRTCGYRLRYAQWTETSPGRPSYWQIATVDPYRGQHVSLALDAAGAPHLAYYDGDDPGYGHALLYAHRPADVWQSEIVDDGGVGQHPSLALDVSGNPAISYDAQVSGALRLAARGTGGWVTQTVTSQGNAGAYSALVLDEAGQPGISFCDPEHVALRYARWDESPTAGAGATWRVETVAQGGDVGAYTALRVDAAGRAHISYEDVTQKSLGYARWTGSAWLTQTVAEDASYGALALDSAGRPQISYYDAASSRLGYARWTGSAWVTQSVASALRGGTSLALDAADRPHISYYARRCTAGGCWNTVGYAHWTGSAWLTETLPSYGDAGYYNALALDASGRPHIAYYDSSAFEGQLEYAYWTGAAWQTQVVDYQGSAGSAYYRIGQYPSLALDAAGQPHISYYCQDCSYTDALYCNSGYLKYARWTGALPIPWSIARVAEPGGAHSTLALDGPETAQISYYGPALLYTRQQSGDWAPETVDGAGDTGRYAALALDTAGSPHISYYDATSRRLRYAHRGAAYVTPTPVVTPSPTATATPTSTPGPSGTPTPSRTPTASVTPSLTRTPTLTFTPSPTPSVTPEATETVTPSPTATATRTPSLTPTLRPPRVYLPLVRKG